MFKKTLSLSEALPLPPILTWEKNAPLKAERDCGIQLFSHIMLIF